MQVVGLIPGHEVVPSFEASDSGFRVSGFGFRLSGFGFRVSGSGFQGPGSRFQASGFRFRATTSFFVSDCLYPSQVVDLIDPEDRTSLRATLDQILTWKPRPESGLDCRIRAILTVVNVPYDWLDCLKCAI